MTSSFSCSPHWKNVRDLEKDEEKTLESTWNGRHSMHFSVNNQHLSVGLRDYFGRPRSLPDDKTPGPKPEVRLKPTWSLNMEATFTVEHSEKWIEDLEKKMTQRDLSDYKVFDKDGNGLHPQHFRRTKPDRFPLTFMNKALRVDYSNNLGRSIRIPDDLPKRAPWNDRFQVTHSVRNDVAHEYHREYFSRFVEPRTSRMLEHRKNGIERHLMPVKHHLNPDGRDYAPPPDIFADDDVSMARMARVKPMLSPVVAPARPDGSFDLWGGS